MMNLRESEARQILSDRPRMMQKPRHFWQAYEEWFGHLVDKDIRLLELGVYEGDSLLRYRDYFKNGIMVGLDMNPVHIVDPTNRIHVYQGYQQDTAMLDLIGRQEAPDGFDVIIDDCSHIGELTRVSFWHLFQNHLKPGGIYAIEDVATAYMPHWADGKRYKPRVPTSGSSRHSPSVGLAARWRAGPFWALSHLIALGRRLLPNRAAQFLCRSTRLKWLLQSVQNRRFGYRRKLPSHMYGMAGFAKELMDICLLGERSGTKTISRMHVYSNLVILLKSSTTD